MVLDTYNPIRYQKKQNGSKIDMYVNVNKNNIKMALTHLLWMKKKTLVTEYVPCMVMINSSKSGIVGCI